MLKNNVVFYPFFRSKNANPPIQETPCQREPQLTPSPVAISRDKVPPRRGIFDNEDGRVLEL